MTPVKTLLKSPSVQEALAWLLAGYIWLAYILNRKTFDIRPDALSFMRGEAAAIFAFWHGRMMLCPPICPPKRVMRVLISHHRDGALISRVIARFGQHTVSGSTSKGGREAAAEILQALAGGDNIGITPDGPRGPAGVVSGGVIALARLSGAPIVPVTFAASRSIRMRSWDKFLLALPLGHVAFSVGMPITVPAGATEEEPWRLELEQNLNALVARAEAIANG